jgi:hypothetical protein
VAHGTGRSLATCVWSRARALAFFAMAPTDCHGVYLPQSASIVHRAAGPGPIGTWGPPPAPAFVLLAVLGGGRGAGAVAPNCVLSQELTNLPRTEAKSRAVGGPGDLIWSPGRRCPTGRALPSGGAAHVFGSGSVLPHLQSALSRTQDQPTSNRFLIC